MNAAEHGSVANAVLAVDEAGRVIYVNLAGETLTGRARHDLLGQPLRCVLEAGDGATPIDAASLTRRAMGGNRRVGPADGWVVGCSADYPIAIEWHAEPIRNRDGIVTGAVIVFYDNPRRAGPDPPRRTYNALPQDVVPSAQRLGRYV
jgi:PAS domain S-box-containing protein